MGLAVRRLSSMIVVAMPQWPEDGVLRVVGVKDRTMEVGGCCTRATWMLCQDCFRSSTDALVNFNCTLLWESFYFNYSDSRLFQKKEACFDPPSSRPIPEGEKHGQLCLQLMKSYV